MKQNIKKYNEQLQSQVKLFEKKYGKLEEYFLKHFLYGEHSMFLEDRLFLDPDLKSLENYENWLNDRN